MINITRKLDGDKYLFIFLLLLYNLDNSYCITSSKVDERFDGVSKNNNNNNKVLNLFSNAINSIFSPKNKLSSARQLELKPIVGEKLEKSLTVSDQGRDSLFLYPLGKYTNV